MASDFPPSWTAVVARGSGGDWVTRLDLLRSPGHAPGAEILKRDRSGEVVGLTLDLGGEPTAVVVKRPRATRLGRRVADVLRRSRSRRAWDRTRRLADAGLPTERPLLLLERRRLGVVVEHSAVYGRVDGPTLATADLDAMADADRRHLLGEIGRCLRQINDLGLCHRDAKGTNWVVATVDNRPTPVMLDCDGVVRDPLGLRRREGIERLLRSLREHPQGRPEDEAAVLQGFLTRVGSAAT